MRHAHKVLASASARERPLLPQRILADAERVDAHSYQQVNDTMTGRVEVALNLPRAVGGEPLHLPGSAGGAKRVLKLRPAFVIELLDRLHWAPVNMSGREAHFV